jgi:hypothetical protein
MSRNVDEMNTLIVLHDPAIPGAVDDGARLAAVASDGWPRSTVEAYARGSARANPCRRSGSAN